MISVTVKTHSEVHQGCWTLTRDLHSEGVAADANEVEGHALHRHPAVGQPHGEDALHLHGSVLLPLHLHRESLWMVLLRQSRVVPIAPASLQRAHKQTVIVGRTAPDLSLSVATHVGRIPKHWYQMIWGAGYPKEVQVSVVIFSHLTTAMGFSVSNNRETVRTAEKQKMLSARRRLSAAVANIANALWW